MDAIAGALWCAPSELTGQPSTRQDTASAEADAGLKRIEIALERYELGIDPEVPVRAWPQIQADIDRLVRLTDHVVDYTATLIGELQAAKTAYPELLPARYQAFFWSEVGRALCAGKKTRQKGVHVLLPAEHLAPQLIHIDVLIRKTVTDLLRQVRRDAGGRELRGLAWRMGITPVK